MLLIGPARCWQELFRKYDVDNDGMLNAQVLLQAVRA